MKKEKVKKMKYVPPTAKLTNVVMDSVVAASPIQEVELNDWEYEDSNILQNNADVWLDL
jgi:hypothetical protein